MQTKHCSCLYSSICLGSPAGDLGDDSTHMPPSSALPDFWYFTNPVEICSSFCSVFWGRTSAQLAGADPRCYLESISQITMTRAFSCEKNLVLTQASFRRSFQNILIYKILLSLAMLVFQTNWKALTDILKKKLSIK